LRAIDPASTSALPFESALKRRYSWMKPHSLLSAAAEPGISAIASMTPP